MSKLLVVVAFAALVALVSAEVTRKDELEAAIFLKGGKAFEPKEMISMVDELSEIYAKTKAVGTHEDKYFRKWTAVLSKMSHPSKANCADLSYFKDFAFECQQNSYMKESTAAFLLSAQKQQEQMC